jgi:hypothetical protein
MRVERNGVAGMGSSENRVRLCSITSLPFGTTLRLRLKRIQPNPLALVGIGTTNRSAGSTREADVSTNTRFRLMDGKSRRQSPRYGVRLSQACFDE